ncbi:MAG TPA: hypothetical protein VFG07_08855 [Thermoplasmata archaeon]|nr:hypothetical protein [Thermoplasmata archaeon]
MAFDWLSSSVILPELHAALGAGVVFGVYLLLGGLGRAGSGARPYYYWSRLALVGFLVIVFLKELLWDPLNEKNNPFVWQGLIDFGWYTVGIVIGLAGTYARYRRL